MKIAIISNTSWNILNFRLGLIQFLQTKGFEVVYIAPFDETVSQISKISSVPYYPLKHLQRKGYNPYEDFMLSKELYTYYKNEKIDIAISFTIKPNIYSSIAGFLANTKTIANITGLGFVFLKNNLKNTFTKKLLKFSLGLTTKIVFQNNTDKNLFQNSKLCSASKSHLINGSGINTAHYHPQPKIEYPNKFIFLFIGRLLFDKGIREFITAADMLTTIYSDIEFHIVGAMDEGNPSAVSLKLLNEWLNSNKALKYYSQQSDVRHFINECDAVILPSYREGIPRVLLEAMALEKPFVTVNSPGCEDVTYDGLNGFLATVKSSESLFKKMKEMYLLDNDKRKEMGKEGRKIVIEKYDEKIIVEEYLKLILTITD